MKTKLALASIVLLALATPAFADDLDTQLDALASLKGDDYVAARDKLVAQGDSLKAPLAAKLSQASWTDATFGRLAVATIVQTYLEHPDLVKKVQKLEGVDPAHYSKRRRAEPECGRELKLLGKDAAGAILEVETKTLDRYFTSDAKPDVRAKEVEALEEGLVSALATTQHPSAFFVCRDKAKDPSAREGVRLQAAEGLGTLGTKDALSVLVALHDDATTPLSVRLATLRGAARVPSADALAFLTKALSIEGESRAAVIALGAFGSAWGWEARPADVRAQGDALRAQASQRLVDVVRTGTPVVPEDSVIEALETIAHPSAKDSLTKASTDESLTPAARALASKALARVSVSIDRHAR